MKDLLSLQSFLLFLSMLAVTYSTRLIGFFCIAQPYIEPSCASSYGGCAGLRVDFCDCALFCIGQTA